MTASKWAQLVDSRTAPTAVFVWAAWSRSSVELLPSILELEHEYAPLGVKFLYLSLDDQSSDALALMKEVHGPTFYRLTATLEEAMELLQIHEPPALLGYRIVNGTPLRLEPGLDNGFVATEDVVALLEELVPKNL